jgi:hypothetical protein
LRFSLNQRSSRIGGGELLSPIFQKRTDRRMKRKDLMGLMAGLLIGLACIVEAWATSTLRPTGNVSADAAGVVTFTMPVRTMLSLTNLSANTVYFKFYRDYVEDTDTTVSSKVFDVALDTSETIVLGRDILLHAPVENVGIFGKTAVYSSTTPTLGNVMVSGWR